MSNALVLNSLDRERLEPFVAPTLTQSWPILQLRRLFDQARVVLPRRIPADVVTMNSRVRFRDLQWDDIETVTLVYPNDASDDKSAVSVTSPLGAALLGARVGDEARWIGPRGPRRVLIEALEYQPEQDGRYDL
jgi:regulator of nucleoside diphosphate kinase